MEEDLYLTVQQTSCCPTELLHMHATTGKTSSQLFLKRDIRTQFDLLKPDCERHVLEKQSQQKASHDKAHSRDQKWFVGQ